MATPAARQILPTAKSAAEIRADYDLAVRQRSFFSARTTQARYLRRLRDMCDAFSQGNVSQADAETALRAELDDLGYDPETGGFPGDEGIPPAKPGELRDLSSHCRLDLILRTQQQLSANLARKAAAAADPLGAFEHPAWRLVRMGAPLKPRDWHVRWQAAYAACGGEGAHPAEMVALKSSPIWAALGEYGEDSTGSDCPPFAYNSTMDWEEVDRDEAGRLGLVESGDVPAIDFDGSLGESEIASALDNLSPEDLAALQQELAQWL